VDPEVVVDTLLAETTHLISHIATAGGKRASLSQFSDRAFLSLASALEHRGIPRKVSADMFGLPLRSYQVRLQRAVQLVHQRNCTLWNAIVAFLARQCSVTRRELLYRFRKENNLTVASIVNDLIRSGAAYSDKRGDEVTIGLTSYGQTMATEDCPLDALVWVTVFRFGPITIDELKAHCPSIDAAVLPQICERLLAEGRICGEDKGGVLYFLSTQCDLPWNAEGWLASLVDHFRTVTRALSRKVESGQCQAAAGDLVGGSTFDFDLHPNHPLYEEVTGLLQRFRVELRALRARVEKENAAAATASRKAPTDEHFRLSFYIGQCVERSISK